MLTDFFLSEGKEMTKEVVLFDTRETGKSEMEGFANLRYCLLFFFLSLSLPLPRFSPRLFLLVVARNGSAIFELMQQHNVNLDLDLDLSLLSSLFELQLFSFAYISLRTVFPANEKKTTGHAERGEQNKNKERKQSFCRAKREKRRRGGGRRSKTEKNTKGVLVFFFNCAAFFFPLCLSILKEQRVGWGPSARQKVKGKKRMKKDLKKSTKLSMS